MSRGSQPDPGEADRAEPEWQRALAEFVRARIELIRYEARAAGRGAARALGAVLGALLIAALFYLLLLAGIIGWLDAAIPALPWYALTLIVAAAHGLAALALALSLRRHKPDTSFPLTRTELAKDREWLEQIKTPSNSQR